MQLKLKVGPAKGRRPATSHCLCEGVSDHIDNVSKTMFTFSQATTLYAQKYWTGIKFMR